MAVATTIVNVRMPPELADRLTEKARLDGVSRNALMVRLLGSQPVKVSRRSGVKEPQPSKAAEIAAAIPGVEVASNLKLCSECDLMVPRGRGCPGPKHKGSCGGWAMKQE